MSRMTVPLDYGFSHMPVGTRPAVHCEMDDEYQNTIWLSVPNEESAVDTLVTLTPDEARGVAAMLAHFAAEAER